MSRQKMRSNWVAGDGDLDGLGLRRTRRASRRRRPRRWMLATAGVATLATAAALAGTVMGVGATPALALCDSSGGTCVDTASASGPSLAVLPLAENGDDSLTVSNEGTEGDTEVGVVGYLTSDGDSASDVTTAAPDTEASVRLGHGQRRHLRLSGVPGAARAVIVQVGSSYSRTTWSRSRAACATTTVDATPVALSASDATADRDRTSTDATATEASAAPVRSCGSARIALSGRHDRVSRVQVVKALRDWAARTSTTMPTTTAVSDFARTVDRARVAAAIAPGPRSLKVSWQLVTGSQQVSAVRLTRTAADGTGAQRIDRPATSGSYTFTGLTGDTSYTVSVAPVVSGSTGTPITMTATALGESAAGGSSPSPSGTSSASAAPSVAPTSTAQPSTAPSAPADDGSGSGSGSLPGADAYSGWTRVIAQDFGTDASLGSFASKYPGWAGYDGNTSGASGTTWNSSTTMSVSGSVLRMRNWVSGGKPQAGALTPIVPGSGAWNQQAQTYGKYVVRFKADSVKGFKVAWLLWPSSNDWSQGELDFPEANLDGTVNWSAHDVTGDPSNQTWGATSTRMADGRWHTATTTWEPGKVTYDLDGAVVKTVTDSKYVPTAPMRWDLQNEVSTDGSKPAANADGSVYIDWVAQYKRG